MCIANTILQELQVILALGNKCLTALQTGSRVFLTLLLSGEEDQSVFNSLQRSHCFDLESAESMPFSAYLQQASVLRLQCFL